MFRFRNKKINYDYALLTRGLAVVQTIILLNITTAKVVIDLKLSTAFYEPADRELRYQVG